MGLFAVESVSSYAMPSLGSTTLVYSATAVFIANTLKTSKDFCNRRTKMLRNMHVGALGKDIYLVFLRAAVSSTPRCLVK